MTADRPNTPTQTRPIPASLPVAPRNPEAEVDRTRALIAALDASGVRADGLANDAIDALELGEANRAAELSQHARERALAAGDYGTLALATAVLAAVRISEGRAVEATALVSDAERFVEHAGLHPQAQVTRKILDTIA